MDLSRGSILVARSLDESDIFQNEKWLKVYIWCLIQANHKGKNVPVNIGRAKTSVWVERGQFIFGRNKAAEKLGMSPSTVRNIMQKLCDFENLAMQKDTHFSIVTVLQYDVYQTMENYKGQAKGQPKDSQRTAEGQPEDTTNTPKSPKSPKKKKLFLENSNEFRLANFLYQNILKNKPDYKKPNLQKWADDADKMLRIDNRNLDVCKKLIIWVQNDDFERTNVLSISKLKKRFDNLEMKMNKKPAQQKTDRSLAEIVKDFQAEEKNKEFDIELTDYEVT